MQTYKPGSVSYLDKNQDKILTIYLVPTLPSGSINLPIPSFPLRNHKRATYGLTTDGTYSVFQHARFTMPLMSPSKR